MGISNEMQALQPGCSGSWVVPLVMQDHAYPAAQAAARPAIPGQQCQACCGVMPWFTLKLFILSPLLCLFCPVVMILHGLWEG